MRLIVFTAPRYCDACKTLHRSKTLARFADLHPDVPVEVVDLSDEANELNEAKARKYRVSGIPAFRVVDGAGAVLLTSCGLTNLEGLRRMVERARTR